MASADPKESRSLDASVTPGGIATSAYDPRRTDETVLYQVVAEQLETFLALIEKANVDEKGVQIDYTIQFPDFIAARPTPVASRANIPADSIFPARAANVGLSGGWKMPGRSIYKPEKF